LDIDGADYWDSGLVYNQHIDVAMLSGGFGSHDLMLSGFVSAVAATANDLYFIDEGAGQLVHVDLASMTGRVLANLQSPSVPGLYADIDGKVYVVDRARNSVLVYDSYLSDIRFLPLGAFFGNPFDLAMGGQGQWLFVLDNLEGNIATLDVFGGVTQVMRAELPSSMSFIRPRAMSAVGASLLVLDSGADQVIEFDLYGKPVGVYAEEDLRNPKALAADHCGRFYVGDDDGLYLGFADMSLPGRRIMLPELAGRNISDLWTDGVFVFVATRDDGIHMLLIDPSCGAP
jgi:DNA-binding beta-propeller fold protein YncE